MKTRLITFLLLFFGSAFPASKAASGGGSSDSGLGGQVLIEAEGARYYYHFPGQFLRPASKPASAEDFYDEGSSILLRNPGKISYLFGSEFDPDDKKQDLLTFAFCYPYSHFVFCCKAEKNQFYYSTLEDLQRLIPAMLHELRQPIRNIDDIKRFAIVILHGRYGIIPEDIDLSEVHLFKRKSIDEDFKEEEVTSLRQLYPLRSKDVGQKTERTYHAVFRVALDEVKHKTTERSELILRKRLKDIALFLAHSESSESEVYSEDPSTVNNQWWFVEHLPLPKAVLPEDPLQMEIDSYGFDPRIPIIKVE